jgi:hypothetical protein
MDGELSLNIIKVQDSQGGTFNYFLRLHIYHTRNTRVLRTRLISLDPWALGPLGPWAPELLVLGPLCPSFGPLGALGPMDPGRAHAMLAGP